MTTFTPDVSNEQQQTRECKHALEVKQNKTLSTIFTCSAGGKRPALNGPLIVLSFGRETTPGAKPDSKLNDSTCQREQLICYFSDKSSVF